MTRLHELNQRIQAIVGANTDGVWGPQSAEKTLNFLERATASESTPAPKAGVDARSAQNIATLQPWMKPVAEQFLQKCQEAGLFVKIIDGSRTYTEQAELYRKYKAGGPQAAPAGHSNHNFMLAFDIGLFDANGKYLPESAGYAEAGAIGKSVGLTWGGDWENADEPHFELRPQWAANLSEKEMLAELRGRQARGESYQT